MTSFHLGYRPRPDKMKGPVRTGRAGLGSSSTEPRPRSMPESERPGLKELRKVAANGHNSRIMRSARLTTVDTQETYVNDRDS